LIPIVCNEEVRVLHLWVNYLSMMLLEVGFQRDNLPLQISVLVNANNPSFELKILSRWF
jgi:hypothetical protein